MVSSKVLRPGRVADVHGTAHYKGAHRIWIIMESELIAQKKPNEFMVGGSDNDGSVIVKIYFKSLDYVVYRTKSAIRIDFADACSSLDTYMSNHHRLSVELARIYSWLPESLSWSEAINRQIARAIVVNIQGMRNNAVTMLAHAEDRILKLKLIQGRLQYTISSLAVAALFWLVLVLFQLPCLRKDEVYAAVSLCGALGGVLSVAIGYSKLEIDIDANSWTNCLVGASRIFISIIAALFVYFAVTSGAALSFFGKVSSLNGVYLACMIAGFSERLVPNIMSNVSTKISERD